MKKNVLLVDDEVCLTESLRELLEHEALHIFTAKNGREALDIILANSIDCVVSDIKMPVMDGFTLCQLTREEGHHMPFIFCSGHACEKLEKRSQELGALALLPKPCFLELEEMVHDLLIHQMKRRDSIAQI
jgi:CheY-like chemotaxis protein